MILNCSYNLNKNKRGTIKMKSRITLEQNDLYLLVYILENMNNEDRLEYCKRENQSIIDDLNKKFRKNIKKNNDIIHNLYT